VPNKKKVAMLILKIVLKKVKNKKNPPPISTVMMAGVEHQISRGSSPYYRRWMQGAFPELPL
jgi:hypothetical protein